MNDFVHLRLYTDNSINSSILSIKHAVSLAGGMFALAKTDHHNMFGIIQFYKTARKNKVKPIIGCEVNIQSSFNYKLLLFAKNKAGYVNICELLSRSYIENIINDTPFIKEDWLLQKNDNIVVLSGGENGDITQLIVAGKIAEAKTKSESWKRCLGNNYFLEIQRVVGKPDNYIEETVNISKTLDVPLVATHSIQFAHKDDYLTHEVRSCIARGDMLDDTKREVLYTKDQYFKSSYEMQELFDDIPSAIQNTVVIVKMCNVEIQLGDYFLPDFKPPTNETIDEYLASLSRTCLDELIEKHSIKKIDDYKSRLETEIATIIQMGFAGYFLIVADFITWAKKHKIPVGAGRGSGAGSLVAYSLGITDIDPIEYSLLFERFLNIERISMPDFDIDFCQEKRELVIDYVKQKYGNDAVSQIATFGTMSSKAVIKDVGRVLGLPYGLCDSVSKLIINTPAKSFTLDEAYIAFPELTKRIDNADDELRRLWELSLKLEGLIRNVGKHAAGILIAPTALTNFCPLYVAESAHISQFDKDEIEAIGLVKFDFLGLRNLTSIQETTNFIKKLFKKDIELSCTDFSDKNVYKLLSTGNTMSVFQLESKGMSRLLKKLKPSSFEDIIAVLALYRPGPLGSGMVDDFIKRKHGLAPINYFHNDLKVCLASTYGIIVYQEQVMQIAQIIGGYSLGSADLLRRAMGKKKPEEMIQQRSIFTSGAISRGYKIELAEELFDLMAMFAEYGFNKSHSAAYSVISYHTAYLKCYFNSCFMAATLSSELDNTDKLAELLQDCKNNNITVLLPDINLAESRFSPLDEKTVCYGILAIKGIGAGLSDAIIAERKSGKFNDVIDFFRRISKKLINKRSGENLIKAGAFDSLEPNRKKLLANISSIIDFIEEQATAEQALFSSNYEYTWKRSEYFSNKERLVAEKQALGLYLSGKFFDSYKTICSKFTTTTLDSFSIDSKYGKDIVNNKYSKPVLIAGVINYISSRTNKSGTKMFFIGIEDSVSSVECVIQQDYEKFKHLLKQDELIVISGNTKYDVFRDEIKIHVKFCMNLDTALEKLKSLDVKVDSQNEWEKIKKIIDKNGKTQLIINYFNDNFQCKLQNSETLRINVDEDTLRLCVLML